MTSQGYCELYAIIDYNHLSIPSTEQVNLYKYSCCIRISLEFHETPRASTCTTIARIPRGTVAIVKNKSMDDRFKNANNFYKFNSKV